jgi:hypothetical protein
VLYAQVGGGLIGDLRTLRIFAGRFILALISILVVEVLCWVVIRAVRRRA